MSSILTLSDYVLNRDKGLSSYSSLANKPNRTDIRLDRPDESKLRRIEEGKYSEIREAIRGFISKYVIDSVLAGERPLLTSNIGQISIILKQMWIDTYKQGISGGRKSIKFSADFDYIAEFADSGEEPPKKKIKGRRRAVADLRKEQSRQKQINKEYAGTFNNDSFDSYLNTRTIGLSSIINNELRDTLVPRISSYLKKPMSSFSRQDLVEYVAGFQDYKEKHVQEIYKQLGIDPDKQDIRGLSEQLIFGGMSESSQVSTFAEKIKRLRDVDPELFNRAGLDKNTIFTKGRGVMTADDWIYPEEREEYLELLRAMRTLEVTRNSARKKDKNEVYNKTRRIIQTEVSAAYNLGRLSEYIRNGVSKVQWVTVAEQSNGIGEPQVCEHCKLQHGKVFTIRDLITAQTLASNPDNVINTIKNPDVPLIPYHPHCRCYFIPVPDSTPVGYAETAESGGKKLKKGTAVASALMTGLGVLSVSVLYAKFGKSMGTEEAKVASELLTKLKGKALSNVVDKINKRVEEGATDLIKSEVLNKPLEIVAGITSPAEVVEELIPADNPLYNRVKEIQNNIGDISNRRLKKTKSVYDPSSLLVKRNQQLIKEQSDLLNLINNTLLDAEQAVDGEQFSLLYEELDDIRKSLSSRRVKTPKEIQAYKEKLDRLYFTRLDASVKLAEAKQKYRSLNVDLRSAFNETAGVLAFDDDIVAGLEELKGITKKSDGEILFSVDPLKDLGRSLLDSNNSADTILSSIDDKLAQLEASREQISDLLTSSSSFIQDLNQQEQLVKKVDSVYKSVDNSNYSARTFDNNRRNLRSIRDRLSTLIESKGGIDKLDYTSLRKTLVNVDKFIAEANRSPNLKNTAGLLAHLEDLLSSGYVDSRIVDLLNNRASKIKSINSFNTRYSSLQELRDEIAELLESAPKLSTFDRLGTPKSELLTNLRNELRNLKRRVNQTSEVKSRIKQVEKELRDISTYDFRSGTLLTHFLSSYN